MIPNSFYSDISYEKDGFENGPTFDWIKANREQVDSIVVTALFKALCVVERAGEVRDVGYKGISLHIERHHYAKCCLVDTEHLDVTLTWSDLLAGYSDTIISNAWDKKHVDEQRERAEAFKRQQETKEAQERLDYERLKTKFNPPIL